MPALDKIPAPIRESAVQLAKLIEAHPELLIDALALVTVHRSTVLSRELGPVVSTAVKRTAVGLTVARLCMNGLVSDTAAAIDAVRKVLVNREQ